MRTKINQGLLYKQFAESGRAQAVITFKANQRSVGQCLEKGLPTQPLRSNGERELTEFIMTTFNPEKFTSLSDYFEQDIKPFNASLDYKEQPLAITTSQGKYYFDTELESLIKATTGKKALLGCGKISVKAVKKSSKTQPERIEISMELTPDTQKDYEIIPFHKAPADNQAAIAAFMAKYISKPFTYLENVVGVELNFNKIFYKPEKLRNVSDILAEIAVLDDELKRLEAGLSL